MPVSAIAVSTGKKRTKNGVRIVPSPNPEKKVSSDAAAATMAMRIVSVTGKEIFFASASDEPELRYDYSILVTINKFTGSK